MSRKNNVKFSLKEKVALAVFMEAVPLLINKWKKSVPEKPFDLYLTEIYSAEKGRQSLTKKNKKGGIVNERSTD